MEILQSVTNMIWLMLPAYLASPAASIAIFLTGQGKPIDLNKKINNKRILGNGKTYKGFLCGVLIGIIAAILQNVLNFYYFNKLLPVFSLITVITLPLGAMLGDLIASFFKRRLGLKRGQAFPVLDQLDFVFGAWILTFIFASSWFIENFTLGIMLLSILFTPILHLIVNIIGYRLGISREPW